jgi:hypothetical protein
MLIENNFSEEVSCNREQSNTFEESFRVKKWANCGVEASGQAF